MSKRTFGVEIECGNPSRNYVGIRDDLRNAKFAMQTEPGKFDGYSVTMDGSGIEVRTPILTGEKGYAELTRVMDFLHEKGCYVTQSDGMHVHVGAAELQEDEEACKVLARTWYNNQDLIGRMCSSHRINYKGMSGKLSASDVDKVGQEVKRGYSYQNSPPTKYWGARPQSISLASIPRKKTVEFRLHEGCLDPRKAVAWVRFCQRFVDYSISERKVITCASKTALLDALGLPEDATAILRHRQRQMPRGKRVIRKT